MANVSRTPWLGQAPSHLSRRDVGSSWAWSGEPRILILMRHREQLHLTHSLQICLQSKNFAVILAGL